METSVLDIVKEIHKLFSANGKRLCVAESCTGGYVSHLLTSLSGSSAFFDSSIICYSRESKSKLLGVRKTLIKKHGAVSEEVARAMAEGARRKTGTDFALAITGVLGPDTVEEKRVGLVYIAVSVDGMTSSKGMAFDGMRQEIKETAAAAALEFLNEAASTWV